MGALERINNKIRVASTLGFEPWPHCWEADALTTAPPLLPMRSCFEVVQSIPIRYTIPNLILNVSR